ncbi:Homeobox protein HD-1, partial [Sarracenia purpurea var. burkii]
MPLSMVPPIVHFHVPEVPAANVLTASSPNASSHNASSPNVSHVDISNDTTVPTDFHTAGHSSHVNTPIDFHVDIPHSVPTNLQPRDLNSETTVSAQNHATPYVSAPTSVHLMMTRAKHGIVKPKVPVSLITSAFVQEITEPRSFTEAIKSTEWITAMHAEYNALLQQ